MIAAYKIGSMRNCFSASAIFKIFSARSIYFVNSYFLEVLEF